MALDFNLKMLPTNSDKNIDKNTGKIQIQLQTWGKDLSPQLWTLINLKRLPTFDTC